MIRKINTDFNPRRLVVLPDYWRISVSRLVVTLVVVALWLGSFAASAASSLPLSSSLQARLLTKILMYEKNFQGSGGVNVYVVNTPLMLSAFNKLVEMPTGNVMIKSVDSGSSLPLKRYDWIYLNDATLVDAAKVYALKYRSVLLTGKKRLVEKGITLGTAAEDGRPRFYLNLSASFSADLDWEPRVLSIVSTFR